MADAELMEPVQKLDMELTLEELKNKYYPSIMDILATSISTNASIKIYKGKNENNDVYYGICEDCKSLNKLQWKEACADGNYCCMKLVCNEECAVYCTSGHLNYYYNFGDSITVECEVCNESIQPNCTWWGLSIEEHNRRYG